MSIDGRCRSSAASGFALIEVLAAATCVAIMAASVAVLASVATRTISLARSDTLLALLASRVMEGLQAMEQVPLSPGGTLDRDEPGFVEYFDARGRSTGTGSPGPTAVIRCRWSAESIPGSPAGIRRLQVLAMAIVSSGGGAAPPPGGSVALVDFKREQTP